MILRITKIDSNEKVDLLQEIAQKIHADNQLILTTSQYKLGLKKDELHLIYKGEESQTEGLFRKDRMTRLVVDTQYGQSHFDVKTLEYTWVDSHIELHYQLLSYNQLIDTFHFIFELDVREDGIVESAK